MDEELNPIYDFASLRQFLVENGYKVEQAQGYREIRPEEVTVDAVNRGEIEFTNEGIFVQGAGGERQQVYLYKRDYHLLQYGKPRFHICRCLTIEQFITAGMFRDHYVRANSDPVPVRNIDNGYEETMVDGLPLCRNCLDVIGGYGQISSSQFVELLKQAQGNEDNPEVQEVDIFGYTKDWEQISKVYKDAHDYTCEICGLKIDDPFDRQYIHCHHKNANKLNNNEENLQCLCIRCHSQVDDIHKKNLTTGANGIIYRDFVTKYL